MKGWLMLLLLWPSVASAGQVVFSFDFPVDWQSKATFTLKIVSAFGGVTTMEQRDIKPLAPDQCQQWPDPMRNENSLCARICLNAGDYTLSVFARVTGQQTPDTNLVDLDFTSASPCTPPTQPPPMVNLPAPVGPRPPQPSGPRVPVPVPPLILPPLGPEGPSSFAELVNLGCVSWKIIGPCFCNPTTPCAAVEYWEPAYIVETVKKPGQTLIPVLGNVLSNILSATGIPAFGGGSGGNASGGGHTGLQFNEARVYPFPQILGGPCTSCAPSTLPLTIHYASEADPLWRSATASPSPINILLQVGVWGRLYPRSGKVIHGSEVVGSAMAAVRALSIAALPISPPPNPEAHVVFSPIAMAPTEAALPCIQPAWPRQAPCIQAGTPPNLWETGLLSIRGTYLYIIWHKRTCCVNPAMTTCGITLLGGQGANWCPLSLTP